MVCFVFFCWNREGHENTWAWNTVNLKYDLFQYVAMATAWLFVFIGRRTVFVVYGSMTCVTTQDFVYIVSSVQQLSIVEPYE